MYENYGSPNTKMKKTPVTMPQTTQMPQMPQMPPMPNIPQMMPPMMPPMMYGDMTGPIPGPVPPGSELPVMTSQNYTQGFLKTQIGKQVHVEFLVGTNSFIDRAGVLEEVGVSYIILREAFSGNRVMGDLYSIVFVTFYD